MQKLLLKLKSLNKYIVASLLLIIPLYQKFPFISVPGTFVSIRMEDFIVLLAVLAFLFINYKKIKEIKSNPVFMAVFTFLLITLFSVLSAIFVTKTVSPLLSFVHYFRRIEYLSMLFVGFYAISEDRKRLPYYISLLLIVIFLAFFYGLGQKYFSWPIIITQNEEYSKGVALRYVQGSHINSTFAGHYDLASYLILLLPLMLSLFYFYKDGIKRYIYLLGYFCGLWLLVNTASRISLVSLLFSACLVLWMLKSLKKAIPILIISVLFIGFSSNLIARYERLFKIVDDKIKNIQSYQIIDPVYAQNDTAIERRVNPEPTPTPVPVFEDRSTSIRLNVEWPRALRALTKNPLFGTGYSSITLASDNDYLRSLGETGILGFFSFALIFAWLFLYFKKGYRKIDGLEKVFTYSLFASLVGILINAVFIDIFEASKLALSFWLLMGMSLYFIKNYEKTN